jgi:hypothetical protein
MNLKQLGIGIFSFTVLLMGCATTGVPYSFVENSNDGASISFVGQNPGVRMIYYDNNELPAPAKKTHWEPISFPADKPLKITVHVFYEQSNNNSSGLLVSLVTSAITASRSVNRDVLFECPALEAGKLYKLVFRKGAGTTGNNTLVLTDVETGKVFYQQEFDSE